MGKPSKLRPQEVEYAPSPFKDGAAEVQRLMESEGGSQKVMEYLKMAAGQSKLNVDAARGHAPNETVRPAESEASSLGMAGTWQLHSAAATGNLERLKALLEARVDANATDESGVGALEKACTSGH